LRRRSTPTCGRWQDLSDSDRCMNDGTEHAEIRKLRRLLHRSSDLAAVRSAGEAMKLSMRPPFAKVSCTAKVLITKELGREFFFQSSPKASLEYEIAAMLLAALKESRHEKRRPRNRQSSHNASLEYAEMRMAGCHILHVSGETSDSCTSATSWTTKSNFFTYISPSL